MPTIQPTHIALSLRSVVQRWRSVAIGQAVVILGILLYIYYIPLDTPNAAPQLKKRGWGGWDESPQTEQCYKQERTATLLSLYLGAFGADHWYARHWVLAVFKTLTLGGFGIWAVVDTTLWIIGGVYGTPGCPGGSDDGWRY